jgi:hypothetical protein
MPKFEANNTFILHFDRSPKKEVTMKKIKAILHFLREIINLFDLMPYFNRRAGIRSHIQKAFHFMLVSITCWYESLL